MRLEQRALLPCVTWVRPLPTVIVIHPTVRPSLELDVEGRIESPIRQGRLWRCRVICQLGDVSTDRRRRARLLELGVGWRGQAREGSRWKGHSSRVGRGRGGVREGCPDARQW